MGNGTKVYPPQLIQYDQWGRRVNELHTSEAWRDLKAVAQKEGTPAIFYERKYSEFSRIYGFAKTFLFTGDSHLVRCMGFEPLNPPADILIDLKVYCPTSLTDGAAGILEMIGTEAAKRDILPRLTR